MADPPGMMVEPVAISKIGGRYLLFDVEVTTHLRRTHHILGSFIGTLPQNAQQNLFLGLPIELMPEEARLLVEKDIAYLVDDTPWHVHKFNTFEGEDKKKYLASLRSQGIKARDAAHLESRKKSELYLQKAASKRAPLKQQSTLSERNPDIPSCDVTTTSNDDTVFSGDHVKGLSSSTPKLLESYAITPTTSSTLSSSPQRSTSQDEIVVPLSYALFKHLHQKKYYMMPGLRFGCDYNVYPGDPLRFHSHFLAVGYEWGQEIALLDIISGGRLGTAVKKGFLIGGTDTDKTTEDKENVRTFTIEWGGM